MKKIILLIAASIMIIGCTTQPSNQPKQETYNLPNEQELKAIVIEPIPSNYQDIIKRYHVMTLKDPDSAKYEFYGEPTKAYGVRANRKPNYGWLVKLQVNAKNGFGAYTGYEVEKFILEKGTDGTWYAIKMDYDSKIVEIKN